MNNDIESSKLKQGKQHKKFDLFNFKTIIVISLIVFIFSILLFNLHFRFNIFLSLLLTIIIILFMFYIFFQLFLKRLGKAGYKEDWNDLYGYKIINLPYFKNNIIINSFKKNGENFNEEIGDINDGKDYQKNDRNYYDLFIPYSSLKKKSKYNGIMLFIHGGGWTGGKKEFMLHLCARYTKLGYITATMNYSYLNKNYKEYSIFRILDEITACINDIKNQLIEEGFDGNKLELALGGISAGAHLSLLYGYSIKKTPIPIKFVINQVGPISLEPEYWYKIKNEVLENIESKDIDIALKEKKIIKIFDNESKNLYLMNLFIGNKFTDKEMKEMLENKVIKKDDKKYKEMLQIAQYTFPIKFINSNTIPTLCQYGGRDSLVGVRNYSFLKNLSEKYGNTVKLVYMKEGGHLLDKYDTIEGMNSIREAHYQILNFAKNYFTHDEDEKLLFII